MNRKPLILCLIVAAFMIVWLAACQTGGEKASEDQASHTVPSDEGSPSRAPQITSAPTDTAAVIQMLWETSPHADTFVMDSQGQNSTCTRCHAPVNYVPPMSEIPDSCFVCKFTVDPPPPLTSKDSWANINCEVCHEVNNKGIAKPQYSWLEVAALKQYTKVSSPGELCRKCHLQGVREDHKPPVIIAGTHLEMDCAQCHNAHSAEAACSTPVCHVNVLAAQIPVAGHDNNHKDIACVACHDADNPQVGPDEASGTWMTFVKLEVNGDSKMVPYNSHNLIRNSRCDRCHYVGNPWLLNTIVTPIP